MKDNFKQKQGITLIALVITIIVLLILAGVSIAMLTGQNGILSQAENAKVQQSHSSVVEAIKLEYNNWQIEINTADVTKVASTGIVEIQGENRNLEANETVSTTFLAYLEGKGYIDKDTNKVLVEVLLGTKSALGNGETTDIYVLEENTENQTYNLYYLAEDGITRTDLWNVGITTSGNDSDDPFSYTQEDIDRTIELFNWERVTVTNENLEECREEYGYGEEMLGKTIEIITGTKENYYLYTPYLGGQFPLKKIVIPQTKDESDYVDICIPLQGPALEDYSLNYVQNLETIIYLNDLGTFGVKHNKDLKQVKLSRNNKLASYEGCSNLEELYIPNTVTEIPRYAFEYCSVIVTVEAGSPLTWEDFEESGITEDRVIFE